jgi:hypothetical protein
MVLDNLYRHLQEGYPVNKKGNLFATNLNKLKGKIKIQEAADSFQNYKRFIFLFGPVDLYHFSSSQSRETIPLSGFYTVLAPKQGTYPLVGCSITVHIFKFYIYLPLSIPSIERTIFLTVRLCTLSMEPSNKCDICEHYFPPYILKLCEEFFPQCELLFCVVSFSPFGQASL